MRFLLSCIVLMLVAVACKKSETLEVPPLADYYPMQVGKTFTYRLDSIKTANFDLRLDTIYYMARDTVESKFTDALGRESFRIFRYIRDTMQTQPWKYIATYVVSYTADGKSIEFLDNNLRYQKLHQPLTNGTTWKGNSFIDTKSANSTVKFLDEWNYEYQHIKDPFTVRKGRFDNTISVLQTDETIPEGPFDPNSYQQRNYSVEVYAKGVGMIYKYFIHYTYQVTPIKRFDSDSYGVRLNLVDYK